MCEVHDTQNAENERQTHAHQSIDTADKYPGKDELTKGVHTGRTTAEAGPQGFSPAGRDDQRLLQAGSGTMIGA